MILLRLAVAVLGGYAATYAFTALLAWLLGLWLPRVDAVFLTTLPPYLVYVPIILWVFAARHEASFRRVMAQVHGWGGLVAGWVLFAVFATGTVSVFAPEISAWMRPELPRVDMPAPQALTAAVDYLQRTAPGAAHWEIHLPGARSPALEVHWEGGEAFVDPATGQGVAVRDTLGAEHFVHFHAQLHAGLIGLWVVGAAGVAMLVMLTSGVIVHVRIFADFFTFRPHAAAPRAWLDAHNVLGVMTLPFLVVITWSGLLISYYVYMPAGIAALYGGDATGPRRDVVRFFARPPAGMPAPLVPLGPLLARAEAELGVGMIDQVVVHRPGDSAAVVTMYRSVADRIAAVSTQVAFSGADGAVIGRQPDFRPSATAYRAVVGLHLAYFGGAALRWLYVIGGVIGTAAIGSGLVLFAIKRRRQGSLPAFVDPLNVAAVMGVIIASVGYLWANRLLPATMEHRAAGEIAVFAALWLLSLAHALRRGRRAWPAQIVAAYLLGLGLPVLDLATTGRTWPGIEPVLALAGFAALALRHRLAGALLLAAALIACGLGWGWAIGSVAWVGLLTPAAIAAVLGRTFWRQARPARATSSSSQSRKAATLGRSSAPGG